MSYNVKIIKYDTGYQVMLYSSLVGNNTYVPIDDELYLEHLDLNGDFCSVCLASETGRKSGENNYFRNPFDDEFIKIRTFEDAERSEKNSRNRTIKNLFYDARSNLWEWFITLTFDPKKVDRYSYDVVVDKLKNWLVYVRRMCPNMRYILVPELHKDGAFHFHGLLANCDGLEFLDSGHVDASGQPIFNIGKYNLGWTTATRVQSTEKVSKYLTKYITKDLCAATFGKKRYWKSRNLKKADIVTLCIQPDAMCEFRKSLCDVAQWSKTLDAYITTEYFELPADVDIDVGYEYYE